MIKTRPRFNLLAEGIYEFFVSHRPKLDSTRGYDYYVFDFEAIDPAGSKHEFRDFFFPNEERLHDVLLALGGIEDEEGQVQVDEDETVGMSFKGQIKHVVVKGKERARIEKVIEDKEQDVKDENEPPF